MEGGGAKVPTADLISLTLKKGELSKIVFFLQFFCDSKSLVHIYSHIYYTVEIIFSYNNCVQYKVRHSCQPPTLALASPWSPACPAWYIHAGWCVHMPRELLARNGKFVSVAPLRGGGGVEPGLYWGEGGGRPRLVRSQSPLLTVTYIPERTSSSFTSS